MTEKEIQLVKKSWRHFRQIKPEIVASTFYSKLFIDNPELRSLFPSNMQDQYEKLINMLNIVIARLDKINDLIADIEAMAVRHKDYGTKPEHYQMVGAALLWTLKRGLGDDWDSETEAAWTKCYTVLAETMIAAAV
jgi:hemoglobin-like flavoprotein